MDIKSFWKVKSMADFTDDEWDAICLKCGKCCALKYEKEGIVYFSNRICDGLDLKTVKCTRYDKRLCSECAKVDLELLNDSPELLPETCAYRMLFEKNTLPEYHPLISGDDESVRKAKQLVTDWPNMYSLKNLHRERNELFRRMDEEKWSENKFEEEEDKLFAKYQLEFVAAFPVPKKKHETRSTY